MIWARDTCVKEVHQRAGEKMREANCRGTPRNRGREKNICER